MQGLCDLLLVHTSSYVRSTMDNIVHIVLLQYRYASSIIMCTKFSMVVRTSDQCFVHV